MARRFAAYQQQRAADQRVGCHGETNRPRVIITGFGLFTGAEYNISGVVAQTFADVEFTPATINLNEPDDIGASGSVQPGTLPSETNGAITRRRNLTINGRDFEVCFISLDVIWDLAAAIISYEAEAFQPRLIIMSGRGGDEATFEGGAVNDAKIGASGYQSDGDRHIDNAPQQPAILDGGPAVLPMTWSNALLHAHTQELINSIGYGSMYVVDARPSNNYICNNVSYVVLSAAAGAELSLAGGQIRWQPSIKSQPKVGFFHYPGSADRGSDHVAQWIRVLATAILTELPN